MSALSPALSTDSYPTSSSPSLEQGQGPSSQTPSPVERPLSPLEQVARAYKVIPKFYAQLNNYESIDAQEFERVRERFIDFTGTEKRGFELVLQILPHMKNLRKLSFYDTDGRYFLNLKRYTLDKGTLRPLSPVLVKKASKGRLQEIAVFHKMRYEKETEKKPSCLTGAHPAF